MHIGVDARLLEFDLTGIGRYTNMLCQALNKNPSLRITLYTPSSIEGRDIKQYKSIQDELRAKRNRLYGMFWSQTILPFASIRDQIDIFWGPTHRIPLFLPKAIAKVVTIHDLVWKYAPETMRPLNLQMEKRLMPKAIEMADLIMADSKSTANDIAKVFPAFSHKVRTIHLGSSKFISSVDSSEVVQLCKSKPFFLFVGTLEPRKNLDRLLSAFSLLPKNYKDNFSLLIAGGRGWGGVDIENLIYKKKLQDSVRSLGYVNDCVLAYLYENARFLAMPSLYEGFGLPLVEAMQYGTPVLVSNLSSLPEIAGDAGLVVDPFSVKSISIGIERLLLDDELIKSLSNKAILRAKKFCWEKSAAETFSVFEEAIALRDARLSRR